MCRNAHQLGLSSNKGNICVAHMSFVDDHEKPELAVALSENAQE